MTAAARDAAPSIVDAPAALAFVEAMAGLPMPETTRTIGSAVTLALTVDELRTLLADNTDLVSGLFATLADAGRTKRTSRYAQPTRRASSSSSRAAGSPPSIASSRCSTCRSSGVSRPTRCSTSRRSPAPVNDDGGIGALSGIRTAGAVAAAHRRGRAGELDREAAGHGPWGRHHRLGEHDGRAEPGPVGKVVQDGVALKIDRDDLFDVLAERPDLLRQMFAGMFKRDRPLTATR